MKKRFVLLFAVLFLLVAAAGCGQTDKEATAPPKVEPVNITVAAAASLQDAAQEAAEVFGQKQSDIKVIYTFASSGALQKQIEEGAPADLFISAGQSQMDALEEGDLIVKESRQNLLGNELVLIAPTGSTLKDFKGLQDPAVKKIGIGTPETVPAGKYAQESLTTQKLWDSLQPKLVMAKDVREVLSYVETGNVDAGLVYRSDTYNNDKIIVVTAAPADSHKPITYPLAIVKATKNQEQAQAFIDFLKGPEGSKILSKYGFKPLGQ